MKSSGYPKLLGDKESSLKTPEVIIFAIKSRDKILGGIFLGKILG